MTQPLDRPMQITLGIGLVVAGAFLISVMDVIIKRFDGVLPLWQVFALRGLFTAPILLIGASVALKARPSLDLAFSRWALLRGACITFGLFGFYAALPFISLATAGAGIYLAPIFMTLLSARFLNEPVSQRGWFGVLLGFTGALVLLRPGSDAFSLWALLPVIGAFFYAVGHLLTRTKARSVSALSLAFSHNFCMTTGALAVTAALWLVNPSESLTQSFPFILSPWSMPEFGLWIRIAALGALFASIGVLLAQAYKIAPPPTVGTFEYSYLIFAIVWDIVIFEAIPNATTLLGIVLIVAAGMLVLPKR